MLGYEARHQKEQMKDVYLAAVFIVFALLCSLRDACPGEQRSRRLASTRPPPFTLTGNLQ